MKLSNFSITFISHVCGDTGYNNNSILTFITERGGKVVMPKSSWEEKDLPADIDSIKKIELGIPSGLLTISNSSKPIEVNIYQDDMITFTGDYCQWDGNVAGLLGGMSGYGSHKIDPTRKGDVYEGTYLAPRYLLKGWNATHVVDLEKYRQRIFTANKLRDDRQEYDQSRIAGNVSDQEWLEYIQQLDEAYIEGISAEGISHTLSYLLRGVTDLRAERAKRNVSDQDWSDFVVKVHEAWNKQQSLWLSEV